ncbi:hypothetical protein JRO89_XS05G0105000 [Xanthoceras sorbifolium]|uniref:Uncharacterized protein n=1 Tax=Xanthoceras sorbifolium TaxID=99658 RepID=A0ABQ8I1J2_9ROSI|nr:hypothetical protein JRO89_XS05G0105000 [Xanthoceras sorbifolium]
MMLEVEVISIEIIKPSSSTPDHLRHHKLSFLDYQLAPPVYNHMVFFYPCDHEINSVEVLSDHLKQSLCDVLTCFYPLAGRIKGNATFVDCDDQGVPFMEATVKCQLSQLLENPIPAQLNKLLLFELDGVQELPLGVQFNSFDCGGVGIGACISHFVGDALSFFTFMRCWAAYSASGEAQDLMRVEFVSDTLFPPRNLSGYQLAIKKVINK